jgi:hypothetical protein
MTTTRDAEEKLAPQDAAPLTEAVEAAGPPEPPQEAPEAMPADAAPDAAVAAV